MILVFGLVIFKAKKHMLTVNSFSGITDTDPAAVTKCVQNNISYRIKLDLPNIKKFFCYQSASLGGRKLYLKSKLT